MSLIFSLFCPIDCSDFLNMTSDQFISTLHNRAIQVGNNLYDASKYELIDLNPEVHDLRIISYLKRRAWAEWYFGVETPCRQIVLLPENSTNLKLRLGTQIIEEIRHYEKFSNEIITRGHEWDFEIYKPPGKAISMYEQQKNMHSLPELTVANQFAGEIVLGLTSKMTNNILRLVTDDKIMEIVEYAEKDEPGHIAIGKDILKIYSNDLLMRRKMIKSQERFLKALILQHISEIEFLGCRRTEPFILKEK